MAGKVYKHGMSNEKRDWIIIVLLYSLIGFMLAACYLSVQNYILEGHQSKEGNCNDGTTREGNPTQGNENPISGR